MLLHTETIRETLAAFRRTLAAGEGTEWTMIEADGFAELLARREAEEKPTAQDGFRLALNLLMKARCDALVAQAPDEAPVTKMLCEVTGMVAEWASDWIGRTIAKRAAKTPTAPPASQPGPGAAEEEE